MKKRIKLGAYKPKETNVEKLRVFLAKLNTQQNGK
jgi:hypothetical protein